MKITKQYKYFVFNLATIFVTYLLPSEFVIFMQFQVTSIKMYNNKVKNKKSNEIISKLVGSLTEVR